MQARGIVRHVDSLGRVTLPKELRVQQGMNEGVSVEIFPTERGLFIRLYDPDNETIDPSDLVIEQVEM